jgi:dTDP-D-glucose 4,6-dehydratase
LARLIIKTFDPESPVTDNIEHVVDRKYNDFLYSIDSTKIKQLGWTEKINFEDGLKETTEWYKKNGFDWWKDVSSIYKTHSMEN